MIQRATGPQCLSSRVSALADGSLPDDVRDRALAHVISCPDCRADLDAERLLRARLQTLPAPRPSSALVAALLAMGELSAYTVAAFGAGARHFTKIEELVSEVQSLLAPGDTMLIKGSRFMQMERVVKCVES